MSNHLHTDLPPLTLSFMGANYVARELGYGAADEWGPFDVATNAAFEPLDTFGARFDEMLSRSCAAGFDAMDIWLAHLNWRWATPEHVAIARDLLDRHGIRVVSLAGSFGETPADLDGSVPPRERARRRPARRHGRRAPESPLRARRRCCVSTACGSPTRTIPSGPRRRCSS